MGDRSYVWQVERPAPGLLGVEEDLLVRALSALASPPRLRLLKALPRGPCGGQRLQKAPGGDASTGQLYHHLKELQAAGLVAQKERGSYEIGAQAVVPLLAILAAAYDLAEHRDEPLTTKIPQNPRPGGDERIAGTRPVRRGRAREPVLPSLPLTGARGRAATPRRAPSAATTIIPRATPPASRSIVRGRATNRSFDRAPHLTARWHWWTPTTSRPNRDEPR